MPFNAIVKFLNELNNNKFFQFFIISVIIFSALVIGVKTYDIDPFYLRIIEVVDIAITYLFLFDNNTVSRHPGKCKLLSGNESR